MDKKPYTTPKVVDHGTLAQLTAATRLGAVLDADYPAGTPVLGSTS